MQLLQSFFVALSLFTRIPLPKWVKADEKPLAESAWAFPLAGAVVGALVALLYLAMIFFGIPHLIAAWLTLAGHILLSGGLHEDGLADMADGLASGRSREQKLAAMHDSRIGSYGVMALLIVLSLRAGAIGMFWVNIKTFWVFIVASACSRACIVYIMHKMAFAKDDGLAAQAGRPSQKQAVVAVAIAAIALFAALPFWIAIVSIVVLANICSIISDVSENHFGGMTGDVLGAVQVLSETALLLVSGVMIRLHF